MGLAAAGVQGLPALARAFIGGWETGGIATSAAASHFPCVPAAIAHLAVLAATLRTSSAIRILSSDRSKGDQIARYFNPAAFVPAAPGTFGNAPRNLLRGPGSINFDLSAMKNIPIHENIRMQFRAEFFNAFNNVNLSAPFATVNTPSRFGRIESADSPRIIQFALKLSF